MRSRRPKPPLDPASPAAARTVALRLLTVRARGREDLGATLARRGFERAAVAEALDRLAREGWLDDLAAARSLVRARAARYGRARIARELSVLGFSKETVAAVFAEQEGEPEQTALARAFHLLWKRASGLDEPARRRRVRNALARRGFASDAISAMMKGSDDEEEMDLR
ncbi:MAG: regulatory protein RecX [Acidobacteriota bacterium]